MRKEYAKARPLQTAQAVRVQAVGFEWNRHDPFRDVPGCNMLRCLQKRAVTDYDGKPSVMRFNRRDVALYLFGAVQFVALSADRLKQFSLVGMLSLLAPGSSVELLKLTIFSQLPILLLTPVAGALIDRWNKPFAIFAASLMRAILLLGVPFAFNRTGTLYAFYVAAAVLAVFDLMFAPARSALLPEIVPAERLLPTNAVFWALGIVGTLLGFVGGGWLFDYFSWHASFYADSILYVGAAMLMVPVVIAHRSPPAPVRPPGPPVRREIAFFTRSIRDAIALLRESREIRASLLVQAGLFAVGGVLSVIAIARVQEVAPPGKTIYLSEIAAAFIVGLIVGSALAGLFREQAAVDRTVSVGTLLAGVAIAGMGRTETLIPLSIWAGVLGISMSPVFIVTETTMQHRSPPAFTGRVFAAREALIKAAYIAAAALGTGLNSFIPKTAILVGLGLFLALFGVILERVSWLKTEKP